MCLVYRFPTHISNLHNGRVIRGGGLQFKKRSRASATFRPRFIIVMIRLMIGVAVLMMCSMVVTAQTFTSSPYSIYGAGMLQQHFSGLNRGMSGTGIAVQDAFNLNHINPASYGSITQPVSHAFEMGLYATSNHFSTSQSSESKTSGGLTHINYWFKFKPWWSTTFGLTPFSSMSYDVTGVREIGGGSVNYRYSGSGNINALKMGNAFNLGKNLSVGFNASFLFGSLDKLETCRIYRRDAYVRKQNSHA